MKGERKFRSFGRKEIKIIKREFNQKYAPIVHRCGDIVLGYLNDTGLYKAIDDSTKEMLIETLALVIASDTKLQMLIKYMEDKYASD